MSDLTQVGALRRTQELSPAAATPYRNLILAGEMGIGKTEVAQQVAAYFGASLRDVEAELEAAVAMPLQDLRELYGESRVHNMETDLCLELSLQRQAVIAVHATIMLNEPNRRRLEENGVVLVLTTALNEVLRRLYVSKGDRFHDVYERARTMTRLRQEWKVRDLPAYPQLDTTALTEEEVVRAVIDFWQSNAPAEF